jgi:hypothetical protein
MPGTFNAAHLSVYPGATGVTVTLTGSGTTWVSSAPTFTLSGGTGASITGQVITDDTHATVMLSAGSALGLLTLTDPSSSSTATVQVKPRARWVPPRRR